MTLKPFTIGFTGSTLDVILPWMSEQVGDADKVVVSMAGSGKDIANLARDGRSIRSWDPQELSRLVVQGVFINDDPPAEPLDIGDREGYAVEVRPWHIPLEDARLVDRIAIEGTDYDRAALCQALVRSTLMGRLTAWANGTTRQSLHRVYTRTFDRLRSYAPLPGSIRHTKGSVFDDPALYRDLTDAVLVIDTPKVLNGSKRGGDIYSRGYLSLNSVLAQDDQTLPAWTEDTFRAQMPDLFDGPWRRMLLFHATGCRPDVPDVEQMLRASGLTVPEPTTWTHKGRTDVCWVIDRG